jgi:superfamily II DNA helicase RecQ
MNIKGIKWVIIFGYPYSVADLCQQIGRAVRDGSHGKATLVVSKHSSKGQEKENEGKKAIEAFAFQKVCKRQMLLGFFGQKWEKKQEKCCCVCHPEWDFVEFQSCHPSPERSPSKKAKSQMDKDGHWKIGGKKSGRRKDWGLVRRSC